MNTDMIMVWVGAAILSVATNLMQPEERAIWKKIAVSLLAYIAICLLVFGLS